MTTPVIHCTQSSSDHPNSFGSSSLSSAPTQLKLQTDERLTRPSRTVGGNELQA